MGLTKKKILAFQTPKKKTMTPMRSKKQENISETENTTNNKETVKNVKSSNNLENELLQAYREENNFLRNLKNEVLLYNKLLGITITEDKNIINFKIERESSTGHKRLVFNLEEKENIYIFTLETEQNCSVPEYFYDVIEFDKKAFPLFFYKAMQSVYETRTNE